MANRLSRALQVCVELHRSASERRNLETMGVAIGCTNVECFGAADIPMNGVQQFAHQEEGDTCRPQSG